jgi:hydrogenase nickel incorporation protein HypB
MCATCGCSAPAVVQLITAAHADEPPSGAHHRHTDGHPHDQHTHDQYPDDQHTHGPHTHDQHTHGPHADGLHADGEEARDPHAGDERAPDHAHGEKARDPHAGDERAPDHVHVLESADTGRTIELQQKVLAKNDAVAQRNREWLRERGILAINLMSSPGAGKTTLLERTARDLAGRLAISVIEGDQETALDARRILAAGSRVVQINTGAGCHLDAEMLARGLRTLDPPSGSIVVIENVGNLVCPALFDLGEDAKVVLASVTEGADKPLKYPHMFRQADVVLLNKIDLLPYVDFDARRYAADLRKVSPGTLMLQLSATTGDGLQTWYDWLRRRTPAPRE